MSGIHQPPDLYDPPDMRGEDWPSCILAIIQGARVVIGPFDSLGQAVAFGEQYCDTTKWYATTLMAPQDWPGAQDPPQPDPPEPQQTLNFPE